MNVNTPQNTYEKSRKYCMSLIQKKPRYADITFAYKPPDLCDLCHKSIPEMDFYADVVIPGYRQWGFICQECIEEKKPTFSSETGKLYQKQQNAQPRKEWLLVAGQENEPKNCVEPLYDEYGTMYGYINDDAKLIIFDDEEYDDDYQDDDDE